MTNTVETQDVSSPSMREYERPTDRTSTTGTRMWVRTRSLLRRIVARLQEQSDEPIDMTQYLDYLVWLEAKRLGLGLKTGPIDKDE